MDPNNPYNAPSQSAPPIRQAISKTVAIKRIGILSAGTMTGAMYAFIGLLVGGVMLVIALLGTAIGGDLAVGGIVGGIAMLVVAPFGYGIAGFIGGLIGAVIYNITAGMIGGIRIDLDG